MTRETFSFLLSAGKGARGLKWRMIPRHFSTSKPQGQSRTRDQKIPEFPIELQRKRCPSCWVKKNMDETTPDLQPRPFWRGTTQFQTISEQLPNPQSSVVSYTSLLAKCKMAPRGQTSPPLFHNLGISFFHHSSSPKPEGLNFKHHQLCPQELPQFLTDAGMSLHCIVGIEAACE